MTRKIATIFVPLVLTLAVGAASAPASAAGVKIPGAALTQSLDNELVTKVRSQDQRHTRRSPRHRYHYVWPGHYLPYYYYSSYVDHGCFWHVRKHGAAWKRVRICY